jgi:hypothetical protein
MRAEPTGGEGRVVSYQITFVLYIYYKVLTIHQMLLQHAPKKIYRKPPVEPQRKVKLRLNEACMFIALLTCPVPVHCTSTDLTANRGSIYRYSTGIIFIISFWSKNLLHLKKKEAKVIDGFFWGQGTTPYYCRPSHHQSINQRSWSFYHLS